MITFLLLLALSAGSLGIGLWLRPKLTAIRAAMTTKAQAKLVSALNQIPLSPTSSSSQPSPLPTSPQSFPNQIELPGGYVLRLPPQPPAKPPAS